MSAPAPAPILALPRPQAQATPCPKPLTACPQLFRANEVLIKPIEWLRLITRIPLDKGKSSNHPGWPMGRLRVAERVDYEEEMERLRPDWKQEWQQDAPDAPWDTRTSINQRRHFGTGPGPRR